MNLLFLQLVPVVPVTDRSPPHTAPTHCYNQYSKVIFFGFSKKCKKRKKHDHLVMQPLITQLPEDGTGKSRSPTSNILLKSVDTRNYATENCV